MEKKLFKPEVKNAAVLEYLGLRQDCFAKSVLTTR